MRDALVSNFHWTVRGFCFIARIFVFCIQKLLNYDLAHLNKEIPSDPAVFYIAFKHYCELVYITGVQNFLAFKKLLNNVLY